MSTFSPTLAENSVGSSKATATLVRSSLAGHRGDVHAVERDPPGGDLVQPGHERGERRLPAAGGADEGHGLTGADVEVDVGEQGRGVGGCVGITERHVLEPEPPLPRHLRHSRRPSHPRRPLHLRRLRHPRTRIPAPAPPPLRHLVHHLEVPLRGGRRLLAHRQQEPDGVDRPAQRERRAQEGDQRARGQLAVRDPHRAQHQRRPDRHLGEGHDDPPDDGQQPRRCAAPCPGAGRPGHGTRGPGCGGGRSP